MHEKPFKNEMSSGRCCLRRMYLMWAFFGETIYAIDLFEPEFWCNNNWREEKCFYFIINRKFFVSILGVYCHSMFIFPLNLCVFFVDQSRPQFYRFISVWPFFLLHLYLIKLVIVVLYTLFEHKS